MKHEGQGRGGGRPRKPVVQHIADGTYQACRHAALVAPVEPLSQSLAMPETVTGEAAKYWQSIVTDLPEGTLHRLDRFNLERYVRTLAKWQQVQTELDKCNPTDKAHYTLVQSSIMLNKMLENLGNVLGMSKVSRDKIVREAEKIIENPFEAVRKMLAEEQGHA